MEDHALPSKAPPSEFLGLTETASLIRGDYYYYYYYYFVICYHVYRLRQAFLRLQLTLHDGPRRRICKSSQRTQVWAQCDQ